MSDTELEGAFAAADVVDPATGEVILEANEEVAPRIISMVQEKKVQELEVFFPERDEVGPILSATLKKDPIRTHEESLIEIYRRLRPGDPPTLDSSRSLFENMFFNPAEVRLLAGGPVEAEYQAWPRHAARRENPCIRRTSTK